MITGFNPTDMYAVDHIRRVLPTFRESFRALENSAFTRNLFPQKLPVRLRIFRTTRWTRFSTSLQRLG